MQVSTVKSSLYDERHFELNPLGRSKLVETGESICNMLRVATAAGDLPSCRVEDGLETVKQRSRKSGQCRITVIQPRYSTRATTSG